MNRNLLQEAGLLLRRVSQTARLMVGVGDYGQYKKHMQANHPDIPAMSEKAYFRYCQSARYPGKDGTIKRCPC